VQSRKGAHRDVRAPAFEPGRMGHKTLMQSTAPPQLDSNSNYPALTCKVPQPARFEAGSRRGTTTKQTTTSW